MKTLFFALCLAGSSSVLAAGAACRDQALALEVLGSGGPIADDARASAGYLLWRKGKAVALVDAGGGVFQRFGAADARLADLQIIALTHFHTDHSADLPALLKGLYFSPRTRPLAVSGPDGDGIWPSLDAFLHRLFDRKAGAFAYLHGLLDGQDESLPMLEPLTIPSTSAEPAAVLQRPGLSVSAVGVHHGPVPTLGYLLQVDGRRIAISGDQNLSTDYFIRMAEGADLLVMPIAIGERDEPMALHARPRDIARAVADAAPERLLLGHWMARSLRDKAQHKQRIGAAWPGELIEARDGLCIPL